MNNQNSNVIMKADNVYKSYYLNQGEVEVSVLKGVNLEIREGEFLAIVGASGSGKSTLLHLLGALDEPDTGSVTFQGTDIFKADEAMRNELRNKQFGFVFQFYHLLGDLTVLENTIMPNLVGCGVISWLSQADRSERAAMELLERFGLSHRIHHLPSQLSGGERQRVAIARAMINNPAVLFADEPTGNLDAKTGRQLLDVLQDLHRAGQTIAMVTHDSEVAAMADRTVSLHDGKIKRENKA